VLLASGKIGRAARVAKGGTRIKPQVAKSPFWLDTKRENGIIRRPDECGTLEATMNEEDRVRQRAHEIWEQEGRPEGRQEEHWRQAAAEIAAGGQNVDDVTSGNPASGAQEAGSAVGADPSADGMEQRLEEAAQAMQRADNPKAGKSGKRTRIGDRPEASAAVDPEGTAIATPS
jgi:Protein of unknown function (DUF2934)